MSTHRPRLARLTSAVAVSLAASALLVVNPIPKASAPEPIVVSAAGNVVQGEGLMIHPAAVYYYGYYRTRNECLNKRDELKRTGNYRDGDCWQSNEGKWKGWWRLWMDDYSSNCYDRVGPESVTALPQRDRREIHSAI